jgi:tetratricopeptide (TPR) repeat protein
MIIKGRGLLALGDTAGADKLFALVGVRAPSVALGPFFRGRWRVEQRQPAAALPFLAEAKRRAPHFADPLKYEGDALAALGRWPEAGAAYAKAEPFAPKWGGLHLKWGEALAKLGKAEEAQAQWRTAAKLDLTADERAELARLQGAK